MTLHAAVQRGAMNTEQLRGLGHVALRELDGGTIVGSTRYHDIVREIDRVEIGYTWYSQSWWRSHVNTTCKLLLLTHAFETVGCGVVGLRTDNYDFQSQKAIEGIGAKKWYGRYRRC